MRMFRKFPLQIAMALCLLLCLFGCDLSQNFNTAQSKNATKDVDEIVASGVLTTVTNFNSTNYFIYKGEPMGFQFDMLKAFAEHLGVKLEVLVENNLDEAFELLEKGEVDIFANNITVTSSRKEHFLFTHPIGTTKQVLVQQKGARTSPIRNPLELGKEIVYVQKGSASVQRLKNLSEEIGAEIIVVELGRYEADELIELVANGEIDFVVCDEDIAKVNSFYYGNIDIETPISFEQNLAWALNLNSVQLQSALNDWLETFMQTAEYRIIKGKYFNNPYWAKRILSENTRVKNGFISIYDQGFRSASSSIDWDWRLFAALVYQESGFRHDVQSHMGAYGLMQFMPETSTFFGITHKTDAETQIKAGARYLKWLDKRLESVPDPEQRVKFILAAYNAGLGHVIDARNLAEKHGKDPNKWDDNVDFFILNKSNPDYALDATIKYGYLKGDETFNYVRQIMQRYKHYQNILPN